MKKMDSKSSSSDYKSKDSESKNASKSSSTISIKFRNETKLKTITCKQPDAVIQGGPQISSFKNVNPELNEDDMFKSSEQLTIYSEDSSRSSSAILNVPKVPNSKGPKAVKPTQICVPKSIVKQLAASGPNRLSLQPPPALRK